MCSVAGIFCPFFRGRCVHRANHIDRRIRAGTKTSRSDQWEEDGHEHHSHSLFDGLREDNPRERVRNTDARPYSLIARVAITASSTLSTGAALPDLTEQSILAENIDAGIRQ
jgi:hypothetical protein